MYKVEDTKYKNQHYNFDNIEYFLNAILAYYITVVVIFLLINVCTTCLMFRYIHLY